MQGHLVLLLVSLVGVAQGFNSNTRAYARARSSVALRAGLLEALGGWLLPIKPGKTYADVTPQQAKEFEDYFFSEDNPNVKVATSREEYLASLAFGKDEEMRKPPVEKYWPGNRPPLPNFERKDQIMDATWGRGKYRTEVWQMDINPKNRWWQKYEPSFEELEAFEAGYDFEDPEGWHKKQGLDWEDAKKAYYEAKGRMYDEWLKGREAWNKPMTQGEVLKLKNNLQRYEEQKFRYEDNLRQKQKGQPSLDFEDTGERFKND